MAVKTQDTALTTWLTEHQAIPTQSYAAPFRTPPQPFPPAPFQPGVRVQFTDSKRWWTVRAVSPRYTILTSPFNLRRTVFYTIIDWERGVRGPDDHYGVGYATDEDIANAMRRLNADSMDYDAWPIEVSHRSHSIRVQVAAVKEPK